MVQSTLAADDRLRRDIYRVVHDPDLAFRISRAAQTSLRVAMPRQLPLPRFREPIDLFASTAARQAHDLQVLMSFLGPREEERARSLCAPSTWRLVQRLGGWATMHELPRQERAATLTRRIGDLDGEARRRVMPCGTLDPLRPATLAQVRALLAQWRPLLPTLVEASPIDLARARLTLGALGLILERLALAVDEGRVGLSEVVARLDQFIGRCQSWALPSGEVAAAPLA